jgi:hypothetical protein
VQPIRVTTSVSTTDASTNDQPRTLKNQQHNKNVDIDEDEQTEYDEDDDEDEDEQDDYDVDVNDQLLNNNNVVGDNASVLTRDADDGDFIFPSPEHDQDPSERRVREFIERLDLDELIKLLEPVRSRLISTDTVLQMSIARPSSTVVDNQHATDQKLYVFSI